MEGSSQLSHDATTGFHDIKAVTQVSVTAGRLFEWSLLFIAMALLAILLFRRFLRRKNQASLPQLSPKEAFMRSLGRIRQQSAAPGTYRSAAVELSSALRNYLEDSLPCPASELTPRELHIRLPGALSQTLPTKPPGSIADLNEQVFLLLRQLERIAFATDEVSQGDEEHLPSLSQEAERLVIEVDRWLNAEPEPDHAAL